MEKLQVFEQDLFGEVRVLTDKETGELLFCGKDVARALGYVNTKDAIRRHTKGGVKRAPLTLGGPQEMTFITEGDVYRLITHSKLPAAEKFEKWVFDEVLPSIRRDGYYVNRTTMRLELVEELLSGYDELHKDKAKLLKQDLLQSLKDQIKVLRAENKKLRRVLQASEERAADLEGRVNDVQCSLLEQVISLRERGDNE